MDDIKDLDTITKQRLQAMSKLLSYQPNNPKFLNFHQSTAKTRLVLGGRRSGKTTAGIVEVCWAALGIHPYLDYPPPPLQIRICSVDFASGKQIILPQLYGWLPRHAISKYWAEDRILELTNGTTFDIKSYDQDVEKFEGVARQIILMDEEPRKDIYESNYLRTLAKGINGKLIITCTPLHGMTWLYYDLYDNPNAVPPAVEHWHVTTAENPHLEADAIDQIKNNPAMRDNIEASLFGKFFSHEGLVYKQFDYNKHVISRMDKIPPDWLILLGIDPHDRNPHGVLFCGLTPQNTWIVFDEILETCIIEDLAKKIKAKLSDRWPPNLAIMDTSGNIVQSISGKSVAEELLQSHGLFTIPAHKDIAAGRIKVSSLLDPGDGRKPELYFTANCHNTLREIRHYIWDDWAYRRKEKLDPKEKPMKKDDHLMDCCDSETEILTEDGWKLFKDLNRTEKVATLNSTSWELEYQLPTDYFDNYYSGKMLLCDGVTTNFCITPNHRLYSSIQYNYKVKKNFKFELGTIDKFGVEFPIKKDATWVGKEEPYFYLPGVEWIGNTRKPGTITNDICIPMDNWLQFLGIYLSEGFTSEGHYRVFISQMPYSRYFGQMKVILDRLPFTFNYEETAKRFCCMNKQLYKYVSKFGHSRDKYIPREFKSVSSRQINLLLQSMMIGDGTIGKNGEWVKYDSISSRLINDVQELALKTGRYGNIHSHKVNHCLSPANGKLYENCYDTNRINFSLRSGYTVVNAKRNVKEIDYSGRIYCVTVPNHIIYIRRQGVPMWIGNCLRYVVMANVVYRPPGFGSGKVKVPEHINPKTGYF